MKSQSVTGDLGRLAALVKRNRKALISKWRRQVKERVPVASRLDTATITDHFPEFLDEFVAELQPASNGPVEGGLVETGPSAHGLQRVLDGFDIESVVTEYHILRGLIHELAHAENPALEERAFNAVNGIFDRAIGLAVRAYATQRAHDVQQHRREYLAFVAHDLKTPLNAISLATKVLELKVNEPSTTVTQMLKVLRRNVQHLDGLVETVRQDNANLVAEAGIRLERRTFDLWPLVAGLIYDLHPMAESRGTRLINRVPDDLVVYADAGLLKRVFQNLLANAIRYTPRGKVIVGARELAAEGKVECWVSDNGVGTPEEVLQRVFAHKTETDPQEDKGVALGVGLEVVKTFVEAHDGKVTVESKEGLGSTFWFTLSAKGDKPVVSA